MAEDDDLFEKAMRGEGVKPLHKRNDKVNLKQNEQDINVAKKRRAAIGHSQQEDGLAATLQADYGPHDIVEFKRVGIQHSLFKDLKQGKMVIDAQLDLHRHTVAQAQQALQRFIRQSQSDRARCVLIQHGKGYHSEQHSPGKPVSVIKSYVVNWLQSCEAVLAYSSALPKHGGTGAVYVLLKKEKAN